jgi:membrane protease YdiL (CAAX protease family)
MPVFSRIFFVTIAVYLLFQVLFSAFIQFLPEDNPYQLIILFLYNLIPALLIWRWAHRSELVVAPIPVFTLADLVEYLPIAILGGIGLYAFSHAGASGIFDLLPEEIRADLLQTFYKPAFDSLRSHTWYNLIVLYGGLAVFISFLEEIVFRGIALPVIRRELGINRAVMMSSALWAFIYLNPVEFPLMLVSGTILGYFAYRSGSLLLPILTHSIYSLTEVAAINIFAFSGVLDFPGWDAVVALFGLGCGLIFAAVQLSEKKWRSIRSVGDGAD